MKNQNQQTSEILRDFVTAIDPDHMQAALKEMFQEYVIHTENTPKEREDTVVVYNHISGLISDSTRVITLQADSDEAA